MITGNSYEQPGDIDARLDRIEKRLDTSQRGGGGVGCCGMFMLLWVIYLLYQILEKVS
jgi:hypothetical protein